MERHNLQLAITVGWNLMPRSQMWVRMKLIPWGFWCCAIFLKQAHDTDSVSVFLSFLSFLFKGFFSPLHFPKCEQFFSSSFFLFFFFFFCFPRLLSCLPGRMTNDKRQCATDKQDWLSSFSLPWHTHSCQHILSSSLLEFRGASVHLTQFHDLKPWSCRFIYSRNLKTPKDCEEVIARTHRGTISPSADAPVMPWEDRGIVSAPLFRKKTVWINDMLVGSKFSRSWPIYSGSSAWDRRCWFVRRFGIDNKTTANCFAVCSEMLVRFLCLFSAMLFQLDQSIFFSL